MPCSYATEFWHYPTNARFNTSGCFDTGSSCSGPGACCGLNERRIDFLTKHVNSYFLKASASEGGGSGSRLRFVHHWGGRSPYISGLCRGLAVLHVKKRPPFHLTIERTGKTWMIGLTSPYLDKLQDVK